MRHLIALALLLAVTTLGSAASWTDNGDGTSTRSVTMSTSLTETADPVLDIVEIDGVGSWADTGTGAWKLATPATASTTTIKDMLEQNRNWDNYRFRYTGDALSASDWLSGLMLGFTDTQNGGQVYEFYLTLWKAFVRQWVPNSSTDPLTDGLAVSVPSPPAGP